MSAASHNGHLSAKQLAIANSNLLTMIANVQISSGTITPIDLDPRVRDMVLELSVADAAELMPQPLSMSELSRQTHIVIDSQAVSDDVHLGRALAVKLISEQLHRKYKGEYTAIVFGSTAWGIDNNGSDVDVSIVRTQGLGPLAYPEAKKVIGNFCRSIKDRRIFVENVLTHTRVPVSTMYYYHGDTRVQLQVSSSEDQVNVKTQLILRLMREYPFAAPLFKAIKVWAKARSLINAREHLLNSFSLFLLVIQYLQLRVKSPLGIVQPAPFAYARKHSSAGSALSDEEEFELVDLASPASDEAAAAAVAKLPQYIFSSEAAAGAMQRFVSGSPAVCRAVKAAVKLVRSGRSLAAAAQVAAGSDAHGDAHGDAVVDDVEDGNEDAYEDDEDDDEVAAEPETADAGDVEDEAEEEATPVDPEDEAKGAIRGAARFTDDADVAVVAKNTTNNKHTAAELDATSSLLSDAAASLLAAEGLRPVQSRRGGSSMAQTVCEHLERHRVFFGPVIGGARAIVSHSNGHLFDAQPVRHKLDAFNAPHRAPESAAVARATANDSSATEQLSNQEDDDSLGALLKGFFAFYATAFDPAVHAVSVRQGHLVWRQPLLDNAHGYAQVRVPVPDHGAVVETIPCRFKGVDCRRAELLIEDPLCATDNSARSLHAHRCAAIWTELRRAHALLSGSGASYETVVCEPLSESLTRLVQVVRRSAGADQAAQHGGSKLEHHGH